jgi:hypothetical protein
MLRRQQQIRNHIQRLLDAALFAAGFWIAHVLRSNQALLGEKKVRKVRLKKAEKERR